MRFIKCASFLLMLLGTVQAEDFVLSTEITPKVKSSYIASYLNPMLTPKKGDEEANPYAFRDNRFAKYAQTNGLFYSNIEYSSDFLKIDVNRSAQKIATIYAVPARKLYNFDIKRINDSFQGNLEVKEINGLLPTSSILTNITDECLNYRILNAKFGETNYSYLNCSSRNLNLFVARPEMGAKLDQTFNENFSSVSTEGNLVDVPKHLVFVVFHHQGSHPITNNNAFDFLGTIPIPTNSIDLFLLASTNKELANKKFEEKLSEEFNKDYVTLRIEEEKRLVKKLFDNAYMSSDYRGIFKPLGIKRSPQTSNLIISNVVANHFNSILNVYATRKKDVIALTTMSLPTIVEVENIKELAQKIAKDSLCKSETEVEEAHTYGLNGYKVNCSVSFGEKELKKTYFVYHFSDFDENQDESTQPFQVVLLLGNNQVFDIDDIIFNLELINGSSWDLDFERLSSFELEKIMLLPNVSEWYDEAKGDSNDLSLPWGKFVNRSQTAVKRLGEHSADSVYKLISSIAANLSIELEEIERLSKKNKESDD